MGKPFKTLSALLMMEYLPHQTYNSPKQAGSFSSSVGNPQSHGERVSPSDAFPLVHVRRVSTEGHPLHPLWPPLPLGRHAGPSHLLCACAGGEGVDSPSNSPSGSARRAAGRLVGLHTSPAAPWRHCGSWQGSVGAAGGKGDSMRSQGCRRRGSRENHRP